jgi:hypothetical protein
MEDVKVKVGEMKGGEKVVLESNLISMVINIFVDKPVRNRLSPKSYVCVLPRLCWQKISHIPCQTHTVSHLLTSSKCLVPLRLNVRLKLGTVTRPLTLEML